MLSLWFSRERVLQARFQWVCNSLMRIARHSLILSCFDLRNVWKGRVWLLTKRENRLLVLGNKRLLGVRLGWDSTVFLKVARIIDQVIKWWLLNHDRRWLDRTYFVLIFWLFAKLILLGSISISIRLRRLRGQLRYCLSGILRRHWSWLLLRFGDVIGRNFKWCVKDTIFV